MKKPAKAPTTASADSAREAFSAGAHRVIGSALEIARHRAQTLSRIRAALESCDNAMAVKLMRVYCGLDDEQESYSTPSRVN
jgi:hypothetical protein